MATVTVSLASSGVQPRTNHHSGVTSFAFASGNVTYGGAGDQLRLARIPNQARILSIVGDVQCAATSVQGAIGIYEVLASGTLSARATLASLSAITAGGAFATGRLNMPYKVSLSDDAAVQYAMLAAVASGGTQSTSFSLNGAVLYETGGNDN